jgi:hypothetical protein
VTTEDQAAVVEFLSSSATHGGASVERLETHSSIVFLAGERALKLKRAVRYDYLDFSTVERRKALCEEEVRLNRRTAPSLYRQALPITREPDGSLALAGRGDPVDWVVDMRRFPQDQLLDRMADRGALPLALMRPLAVAIARLHEGAERVDAHGGRSGMTAVIDGNAAGFGMQGAGILDPALCARVTGAAREALDERAVLLDRRRSAGFVRRCHGDLHLRNIVLLDGVPTLFDGIEFNDDLACIDVLYDIAFLVMDLWRRRLTRHANEVFNGYLAETRDLDGLTLLPLFLSCRAAVRAKTSATAATLQGEPQRRAELEQLATDYLRMAAGLLGRASASLIAVGGLSGSGKSTLARELAPSVGAVPGAVLLRSDAFRKRLLGVDELTRLGREAYTPAMSRRVYEALADGADRALRAGHSVIVDAVFTRAEDRESLERVAVRASANFVGVWLDAPEPVLVARVGHRSSDASDADATVIQRQLTEATGRIGWHRVDAGGETEAVCRQAMALLAPTAGGSA